MASSLWFVPLLLVAAGAALAIGLVYFDRALPSEIGSRLPWVFSGGPEGARSLLSAVATSMMTVVGVTFSITIVTLTLAAQQFTPLVIRHFVSDRANQVVLGWFLGTFIYALLVLRTVHSEPWGLFVPQFAVTGAVLLSLVSTGLLALFIHHIAAAIQPSGIVVRVATLTHRAIDHLFPERLGRDAADGAEDEGVADEPEGDATPLFCDGSGYLQSVDGPALLAAACEADVLVRVERRIGEYAPRGAPIATVWPAEQITEGARKRILAAFALGRDRVLQQDAEYGVVQIAAMAVKALSPGINDPGTAVYCVDQLGDLLCHMAERAVPSPLRRDAHGRLRVIAPGTDFARLVGMALDPVRRNARSAVDVYLALLNALREAGGATESPARREVIRCHAELVHDAAQRGVEESAGRAAVVERADHVLRALAGP